MMDLQKYRGESIAKSVIERSGTDPNSGLDISFLLKDPNSLGGSASQQLKILRLIIKLPDKRQRLGAKNREDKLVMIQMLT